MWDEIRITSDEISFGRVNLLTYPQILLSEHELVLVTESTSGHKAACGHCRNKMRLVTNKPMTVVRAVNKPPENPRVVHALVQRRVAQRAELDVLDAAGGGHDLHVVEEGHFVDGHVEKGAVFSVDGGVCGRLDGIDSAAVDEVRVAVVPVSCKDDGLVRGREVRQRERVQTAVDLLVPVPE